MNEADKGFRGKLAVMQPYFFPYLGYFALIRHTDFFVVLDSVQYIRGGWMNRNRVLKPQGGWHYITAPVQAASHRTPIREMRVVADGAWKTRIMRQMEQYRPLAPYYQPVRALLERCLAPPEHRLSRLNTHCLAQVCAYLDMPFRHAALSDMHLPLGPVAAPDEWSLRIAQALGAATYVNSPGGREFFEPAKYQQAGVALQFLDIALPPYSQGQPTFEAGLSILDVLMFNSPEQVCAMLDRTVLETARP